jgi:gamma-glutamylcyclotransferase (GGCT)/AIG2-like uncharacterized protein YtfP
MTTETIHRLFVYGVLLDENECHRLLGRHVERTAARLDGFHRGKKRYFFVVQREGERVDGAMLSGLGDQDLSILDAFEDVPTLYTREIVEVTIAGGERVRSWIYLPTGWERDDS